MAYSHCVYNPINKFFLMIKKMVDYLQNLQMNEPRKDLEELSVIQKKEMVNQWLKSTDGKASSSTCSTVEQKWSDKDVNVIKEIAIKITSKDNLRRAFGGNLTKKNLPTCHNKIKHLVVEEGSVESR